MAVEVEQLAGGLLGWRTRLDLGGGAGRAGRACTGTARTRSSRCGAARWRSPELAAAPAPPPGATALETARDDTGRIAVLAHRPGPGRQARGRRPPDRVAVADGPPQLIHRLGGREFRVAAAGFWQVHPHALAALAEALLAGLAPRPGERVLELYAGAGPLTAVLADAVGPAGQVIGVESSRPAVADAAENLADRPWAEVRHGRVDARLVDTLLEQGPAPDLVVLDPPRAGAGAAVMARLVAAGPRLVGYVSCDPATLARDVRAAVAAGWRLAALRAIDAFPMTHHVECVAVLGPPAAA